MPKSRRVRKRSILLGDLSSSQSRFWKRRTAIFEYAVEKRPASVEEAVRQFESILRQKGIKKAPSLESLMAELNPDLERRQVVAGIIRGRAYVEGRLLVRYHHKQWCEDPPRYKGIRKFSNAMVKLIAQQCQRRVEVSTIHQWLKEYGLDRPRRSI